VEIKRSALPGRSQREERAPKGKKPQVSVPWIGSLRNFKYFWVGLGRAFARHGHRVSFCTSPAFAEIVERCGLRFLPFGTAEEYHAAINNPALWNPRTSLKTLWKSVA
jgi:rhamnosyltransferase subunit B